MDAHPVPPAAVGLTGRALAPDLARGVMLLAIVLANTPVYLYAAEWAVGASHPIPVSIPDAVTQAALLVLVDQHVYPMYAFLVGYGVVMLHRRQWERGSPPGRTRGILVRRNLVLVLLGLAHAALLFAGDIVGVYGILGIVLAVAFADRTNRTLAVWTWVTLGMTVLGYALVTLLSGVVLQGLGEPTGTMIGSYEPSVSNPDYLASIGERLGTWSFLVPAIVVVPDIPAAMLAGMWASRRRLLERPAEHRRLLTLIACIGIPLGWAIGALSAAAHLGVLGDTSGWSYLLAGPATLAGLACGLGYAAAFALLALRLTGPAGASDATPAAPGAGVQAAPGTDAPAVGPLVALTTAVGARSLSCYLAQSVLCAPVLAAWGLGLGAHLTSATVALYAAGVWLVIALGALALDRAGRQGPAEWLVRKVAYRR